jgi:hypothetical protein
MRIGLNVLALSTLVAIAACNDNPKVTENTFTPDPTKARVRIMNATSNLVADVGIGTEFLGVNSNFSSGNSRCIEVDPANPQIVVEVGTGVRGVTTPTASTRTPVTVAQTGFEANKTYFMAIYHPTAVVTDLATFKWEVGTGYETLGDSAGLRVFHAAPSAGAINTYINLPAVAPAVEPVASTMTPTVSAQAVGTLSNYFTVVSGKTYQYRMFRLPVTATSTAAVNSTNTIQPDELATVVIYPASGATGLTATTGYRASTTGGC